MSRNEKIHKLGNVIKEYRGRYNQDTKKWIEPPKPSASKRVLKWIQKLGLDAESSVKAIDGFKSFDEFNGWMRKL